MNEQPNLEKPIDLTPNPRFAGLSAPAIGRALTREWLRDAETATNGDTAPPQPE